MNLGWKLAATIAGWAPEGLLDSYSTERHPVGAQVLDWTRAQVALMRGDEKTIQLRSVVERELLSNSVTTTRMVLTTSGIAQRYELTSPAETAPDAHTLVGRLVGDMPLSDGSRLADHFHTGGFVLVDRLQGRLAAAARGWSDRATVVLQDGPTADCPDAYRSVTGLLVRPDGVIAWATDSDDADEAATSVAAALQQWAGIPTRHETAAS
jgi:hypothetical protein